MTDPAANLGEDADSLAGVLERLPVGVAVFARADATIHAVNSAFRAFLAAEFREFVVRGARITDVLPLAAEPALAAMLRDVEATG
ncbi:MAG: hypothetical protein M3176_14575, partial [Chloroflexota bacterium]|nr:hypothetical protein [Chloroflexota bacterium]